MNGQEMLADRFEAHRGHLLGVAYRMLGSLSDADDAVQEAWLRLSRTDADEIENLTGWLRTVVSRLCLDMLRSAAKRHEEPAGEQLPERIQIPQPGDSGDPEEEVLLADSVGRALLVVLDTLGPAERVAFVLHDLFAVPFDQIAPVVERTPVATKKLASRARHKVQAPPDTLAAPVLTEHRRVVETFLAAARTGDLEALLTVLAPDVVRTADLSALPKGGTAVIRGARAVADETVLLKRNARFAEPALVGGAVGLVVAPRGRLLLALVISVEDGRVAAYEVVADPARLRALDVAVIDEVHGASVPGTPEGGHAEL